MKLISMGRAWSRTALGLLAAASLSMVSLAARADDDPPGRVGRVADVQGKVWMLEAGQGEWFELQRNRPFTTGDRIATDGNSKVELQIGSTTVRLDEGSDLDVTRLDDDRIDLTLHDGAAALRVREPEVVPEVQLVTPEGGFAPRSPGLFRVDRGERGSFAGVVQGELQFESDDAQLTMRAGQRAEFWLDPRDNLTHYTWSSLPNDEFGQWVAREDAADSRYAVQQRPISPEMTGAEDLDRNGQWDTHPEYGAVWYPTTVVAGWAPYRYGRWSWVSPWGWTWVDDASWGFAPFHYGRWVNWRSRWVWAPGQYVRRPVYAPAMVAWVGGPRASVSISMGGRATPAVGWVPLAPREVYYPSYRSSPVYIQKVNVTKVYIDRDRDQRKPVMYTNRGVPGGITVVSQDVLTRREPVARAQRSADTVVMRQFRDQRATPDAPPPPPNAHSGPRVVRSANDARNDLRSQPRPPVERAVMRRAQDMRDERGRDAGQAVPTRPNANGGTSTSTATPRGADARPAAPAGAANEPGRQPNSRPWMNGDNRSGNDGRNDGRNGGQRPVPGVTPHAATPQAPAVQAPAPQVSPQQPARELKPAYNPRREPRPEMQQAPQREAPSRPPQAAQMPVVPQAQQPRPVQRETPQAPQVQAVPQAQQQREAREQQREQREQQREQREQQQRDQQRGGDRQRDAR